jgi:hypothetical protein
MLKIAFFSLAFLITFTSWGQKTEAGWKILNETNYSIQYPANWDLDQPGHMGTTFQINSKLIPEQGQYIENVNLIIHDLRGSTIYLDKFVRMSESKFPTLLTNYNLIESKRVKDTGEYHKFIFTGDKGNLKLKFEQYIWIKGIKGYVLTFTAEQTQFDTYKQTGEKILNSFKIK